MNSLDPDTDGFGALATHLPALWVIGALTLGATTIQSLDVPSDALHTAADEAQVTAPQPHSSDPEYAAHGGDPIAVSGAAGRAQPYSPEPVNLREGVGGDAVEVKTVSSMPQPFPLEIGIVERVIDGDTYDVKLERTGEQARVRLAWLDAPEPRQPFGAEATEWALRSLLGRRVVLTVQDVDAYGRTVAQLSVAGDGHMWDVGATLARMGLAWVDPRYGNDHASLDEDQARARFEGVGLWEQPNPIPPWEWRRGGNNVDAERSTRPG